MTSSWIFRILRLTFYGLVGGFILFAVSRFYGDIYAIVLSVLIAIAVGELERRINARTKRRQNRS